jgi:hypothetical protein
MWRHHFEQTTDMTAEAIWPVLADVARWGEVDHNIDRIVITQPPGPGVPFTLKPRGGPTLSFVIGEFEPPAIYSDVCAMPLARMTTKHELIAGATTVMKVTIEITGPLAFLWGRLVGRKHAAGLPAQTARILDAARVRSQTAS